MLGRSMFQMTWGMKQHTIKAMYLGIVRPQAYELHTKTRKIGLLNTEISRQIGLANLLAPQVPSCKIHKERLAEELLGILAVLFTRRNHVQKTVLTFSMSLY